jgi:hypothetical protein
MTINMRHAGTKTYGPMLVGVQVLVLGGTGVGGVGGVAQGTLVKSKKSSRLGCAASRGVRCAFGPINRSSTNLMTAVWSMGMCDT